MPICANCGAPFPNRMRIDGKRRHIGNRKYCLDCSPFNLHNTRQIHLTGKEPNGRTCIRCGTPLVGKQEKYCSKKCKVAILSAGKGRSRLRLFKRRVVDYKGGKCEICEYDRCLGALVFHHRDPSIKEFGIANGYKRKWNKVVLELEKCMLLCRNCHSELHYSKDP